MARVVAELVVEGQQVFIRQLDDAEEAVEGVGEGAEKSSRKVSGMTSAMTALGGVLATRELAQWGRDAADYAIQLEAMGRKADTVFGDAVTDIRDFSDQHASRFGLAEDALTGLAAGYGDLLVPMGFTRDQAADLTGQTLELAGALGEWSPQLGGAQHALQALGAAMTGEREQLKAYGIVIDEAAVQAELMARGLATLTGEAERQAKAQVTLDLALRGSADAQAQFAAGGDPAIVAAAESRASYAEMRAELGENLLPVMTSLHGLMTDVTGVFASMPEPVQTASLLLVGIGTAAVPIASVVRAVRDLDVGFGNLDRSGKLLRAGGLAAVAVGTGLIIDRLADARAEADVFVDSFLGGLNVDTPRAQLEALHAEADRLAVIANDGFDFRIPGTGVRLAPFEFDGESIAAFNQLDAINRQIAALEAQLEGAAAASSHAGNMTWDLADAQYASMGAAIAHHTALSQGTGVASTHDSAIAGLVRAQQDLARETQVATRSLQDQLDTQRAAVDPVFAAAAAQRGLADAQQRFTELQADETSTAADVASANQDVASAALDLQGALVDLNDAQSEGVTSNSEFRGALELLYAQGLITQGQLDTLAGGYGALSQAARDAALAMLEVQVNAGQVGYVDSFVRQAIRGSGGGVIEDLPGSGTLADYNATPVAVTTATTSTRSIQTGDITIHVGGDLDASTVGGQVRDGLRDALLEVLADEAAR